MSLDKISGQGFIFYVAGFDTTSSLASFCLYELSQNTDLMEKVVQEIDEVLENHNGEISYDSLMEMKYLEKCLQGLINIFDSSEIFIYLCFRDY